MASSREYTTVTPATINISTSTSSISTTSSTVSCAAMHHEPCPTWSLYKTYVYLWDNLSLYHRFLLILVVLLLLGGGLLVNLLVLVAFQRQRLTRSPTNYLLLNLTVANLLLTCVPLALSSSALWNGHWPLGDTIGCTFYASSFLGFGAVCINTKVAIALERKLTISLHWNGMGQRRFALKCIAVTWALGAIWGAAPIMMTVSGHTWSAVGPLCLPALDSHPHVCIAFCVTFLCLFVAAPLTTKSVLYYKVYRRVTQASSRVRYSRNSLINLAIRVSQASQASTFSRKSSTLSNSSIMTAVSNQVATITQAAGSSPTAGFPLQKRKLVLAMSIMVVIATITWLPFAVALLCHTFHIRAFYLSLWSAVLSKTSVLHSPLMYVVCNRRFRSTFINTLFCQCRGPLRGTLVAPAPVPPNSTNPTNGRLQRMNSLRVEPRWRFSVPGLATIDETGSHVALPGSKQNDYDSGYALSSSASSYIREHLVGSAGPHCRTGSDSAPSPGFTSIHEATEPEDRRRKQIIVASQDISNRSRRKRTPAETVGHGEEAVIDTSVLPPVQN